MRIDPPSCPLLTLERLRTGTRWAFADPKATTAPSPSHPAPEALAAIGFAGSEWSSPAAACSRNLLLLLHGLGDAPRAFARLGHQMALPQTTALALRAPLPLPAGLVGAAWHESFTSDGDFVGATDAARSLARDCRPRLLALLRLLDAHGWPPHRVFLLGFAQGGVAGLDCAMHAPSRLGGVVSVCGHALLGSAQQSPEGGGGGDGGGGGETAPPARQTPVLVLAGSVDPEIPPDEARARLAQLQRRLPSAQLHAVAGMGMRMPRSETEMRPVMAFFAEHLELSSAGLEDDPSLLRLDRVGPEGTLHVSTPS